MVMSLTEGENPGVSEIQIEVQRRPKTNPALVYLASLAESGRTSMRSSLQRVATMLGGDLLSLAWGKLRYEHVQAIRTKLSEEDYAPASINKTIAGIRGVMRAAWRLDLIGAETYAKIRDVPPVRGSRLPAGRALNWGEVTALFATVSNDSTPAGKRDAVILAVAYACGLRRAEIASLDFENLSRNLDDTFDVRLIGKGNKERVVFLNDGAAELMDEYLRIRGGEAGPLFYAGRRGGHLIRGQRLTGQSVYGILKKRTRQASINDATPHDLRRTFISSLLNLNVDISLISRMAGHSSISVTARYDRRGDAEIRKASKSLLVPRYGH